MWNSIKEAHDILLELLVMGGFVTLVTQSTLALFSGSISFIGFLIRVFSIIVMIYFTAKLIESVMDDEKEKDKDKEKVDDKDW